MARITVAGESVVVTSAITLENYRMIAKYRPAKLVLKGGDDGKEPIFAVGVATNPRGSINKMGAEFGSEAHDGTGRATITFDLPQTDGDVKEAVAEKVGAAIIYLNKLEETLPDVVKEIADEKATVLENISVQ